MQRFTGQVWLAMSPEKREWAVVDIHPDRVQVFVRGQVVGDWPKSEVQVAEVGSEFQITAQGETLGFSTKQAAAFRTAAVTGLAARFGMAASTVPRSSGVQTGTTFGVWFSGQSIWVQLVLVVLLLGFAILAWPLALAWWLFQSKGPRWQNRYIPTVIAVLWLPYIATFAATGNGTPVPAPSAAPTTSTLAMTTTTASETDLPPRTTTSPEVTAPSSPFAPSSTTTTEATDIQWDILEVEDVSYALAVRYLVHVLVEPGVTTQQLVTVAREVSGKMIESGSDYQALTVGFYDYPEYVGFGYVMGSWDHAPYGDWARADEATLGDYSNFRESSHLRSKDWSQRPTAEEVAIWVRWEETLDRISDFPDAEDEEAAYSQVAADLSITRSEVVSAVDAAAFWPFL